MPGNETRVFKLTAEEKQDATLVVMDSGGSGGSLTTLTLSPIADKHACGKKPTWRRRNNVVAASANEPPTESDAMRCAGYLSIVAGLRRPYANR